MPTTKGFTGQRADAASGLDYFNARYYDPVLGQFTSADTVDGGLNRFGYVGGNPETAADPSGHRFLVCGLASAVASAARTVTSAASAVAAAVAPVVSAAVAPVVSAAVPVALGALNAATGVGDMIADVHTVFFDDKASGGEKLLALGDLALNVAMDAGMVVGLGEGARVAYVGGKALFKAGAEAVGKALLKGGEHEVAELSEREAERATESIVKDAARGCAEGGLSFSPDTRVATPEGEKAIADLRVGDAVTAYDPSTGQASAQTVRRVWINRDTDLLDVTLRVATGGARGASAAPATAAASAKGAINGTGVTGDGSAPAATRTAAAAREETVHTTANHPWLTADAGWVLAGQLQIGEPVRTLDGRTAVVAVTRVVPGAASMWDLTVSNVHTFAVGAGAYVVHNCGSNLEPPHPDDLHDAGTSTNTGGRGGTQIPREGPPNSYQRSASGRHIWVYDDEGEVQWDIDTDRAKHMEWNENPDTGQRFLRDGPKVLTPRHWLDLFD